MKNIKTLILTLSLAAGLAGCSSPSRYHIRQDAAPLRSPTVLEMQDALVTNERKSAAAGRQYTVLGKTYTPMKSEQGYQAEGIASWYGRKFHGYYTSNGEVFNMFAMTAAHKTLPLPSFVKVTNLENGKSAIVRVNDRGPFHDDRIIDLSYAAAYKLGYYHNGTARVKIEAITLDEPAPRFTYMQVAASSQLNNIRALGDALSKQYRLAHNISEEKGLYKLRLGPIASDEDAEKLLNELRSGQFNRAFLLYSEKQL
ncbi:septal ring lytic transglycosylase RlpA family protein [Pseudoalteromonas fenneropenaei]|uniref:Endolytic peptidoglycan transglycosylase RlpA n=1 Tax=Pseudoalteromonas fenneropenaei TaxID=1737459 RepID=A0ABV7CMK5_9GAMM